MLDFLRIDLFMPLLQAGVVWLVGEGVRLIRKNAKIKDGHILDHALNEVNTVTENVVTALGETTVKGYKKENKFTTDVANAVKDEAISKVIDTVGPKIVKTVEKAGESLTNYVSDLIEKKIKDLK